MSEIPTDELGLTALFRRLGAADPEGWARSQVAEGIPQLSRFVFLREAWKKIVSEDDPTWIRAEVDSVSTDSNEPYAGVGIALKSLIARGATESELTDLVRGMQARLLFHLCYLLEDPGDVEPEVREVAWVLCQVDEAGRVTGQIGGLHESVLETDPTGREMRPRSATK